MGSIIRSIIFLFLMLWADHSFGQGPNLEFRTVAPLENLTNSNFNDIAQDSTGFLWIATQEGLFRFNGQSVYSYVDANANYLPSNNIKRLFIDRRNQLWVGTTAGMSKYDKEFDSFLPFVTDADLKGLPGSNIQAINEDKNGNLFVAFENKLFQLDPASNLFVKITEVGPGKINSFIFDTINNIWIAASSDAGLYYYDFRNNTLTPFANNPTNKQSVSANEVSALALIRNELWIATYGGGIDRYNLNTKSFKNYHSTNYFENFSVSVFVDRNGNLWICTLGSLKFYDRTIDDFFNYYHDEENQHSLGKGLSRFFEDNQNNYWTLHSRGTIRTSRTKNIFKHFDTDASHFWNTSEQNITAISSDGNGNLWLGNFYNGIDVFKWQEHRIERYFNNPNNPGSLGNGTVFTIFRDSKNQIWVGTYFGGLQKFNPSTKNFTSFRNNPDDTLTIATNDVRSIAEDQQGNLWIAAHGKGIDRFDPQSNTFKHYNNKNNRLSNDWVFQVLIDSKGNLWSSTAYGLSMLPKDATIFQSFYYSTTDTTTISNNNLQTIYEDLEGTIWIGTEAGLDRYNPNNQTFTRYGSLLKNKNIRKIISDTKNNLWLSTSAGITKFEPLTLKVTNFDYNDGLASRSYFAHSGYTSDHKELFFGGSSGVDYFNTDSIKIDYKNPTVVLTDFKLFNKSINYKSNNEILKKHIGSANQITLDYQSNSIEIFYQAVKLTRPEKVNYMYKLEGFDEDWNLAGTKQSASYTNLKPGNYTFKVKARIDNADWEEKCTALEIIIVPAWWMALWLKVLLITIFMVLPYFIIQWRTRMLVKQHAKLEAIVNERTREIQQKNEQLYELNAAKVKLFSIISHDLRSPFSAILGFMEMLRDNYKDFSDDDRIEMINQIHATTNQAFYLVENLLNWSRLQTSAIQCQPECINLHEVINKNFKLYKSIAESKGIMLEFNIPEKTFLFADTHLLETTLRNLLSNAIKFTPAGGNIVVDASLQGETITISVTDTGTGMDPDQINSLFIFEKTQSQFGTDGEKGSGLGLLLCKEFVEKNQGTITVISKPGKGSTFTFTVPAFIQQPIQST